MSSLTKIPAGVQYFWDDDVHLRRYVERAAMETFAGWSYDEILLPMFDATEDFHARGIPIEVVPLSGSVELAPLLGLSDRIVDLVETGRTLKENGLEVIEEITESTARLIVNRAGFHLKRDAVRALITRLTESLSE